MSRELSDRLTETPRMRRAFGPSKSFLCASVTLWLVFFSTSYSAGPATIRVEPERIDFRFGDALAVRYHVTKSQVKPYLWPIVAPNGAVVTRGWPMEKVQPGGSADHVHQKSGWFSYGDVIPEGMKVDPKRPGVEGVDFWSEAPVHGRIVCVEVGTPKDGRIVTRNEWRGPDGTAILYESRTLNLHDFGVGRLLVVECDLQPASSSIVFGDTKEGAFGVRVNDQLRTDLGRGKPAPPANKITNANGKSGEAECWGRRADW